MDWLCRILQKRTVHSTKVLGYCRNNTEKLGYGTVAASKKKVPCSTVPTKLVLRTKYVAHNNSMCHKHKQPSKLSGVKSAKLKQYIKPTNIPQKGLSHPG